MRRALALAALITVTAAGAATAETWSKFVDAANGTAWSYDGDYSYKDKQSGRLVVMQAISKPEAKLGPSAPGKPDGVGSVVAIDCAKKNLISMGSYTPSKPLEIKGNWRSDTPKKAAGAENEALIAAVCPHIDHVPVK
ncbi:MAG: hypothetical protein JWO33_2013 [Caulobacteraceae bacterium]|nr:hypothetical protein [Caulobacteraceae bacterium]